MSFQSVNTHRSSTADQVSVKIALEKLAKNLNTKNLQFLSELSEKAGINDKLDRNKLLIKNYL